MVLDSQLLSARSNKGDRLRWAELVWTGIALHHTNPLQQSCYPCLQHIPLEAGVGHTTTQSQTAKHRLGDIRSCSMSKAACLKPWETWTLDTSASLQPAYLIDTIQSCVRLTLWGAPLTRESCGQTGMTDQVFAVSSNSNARDTRDIDLLLSLLKFGGAALMLAVVDDLDSAGATKSTGAVLSVPSIIARSSTSRYAV